MNTVFFLIHELDDNTKSITPFLSGIGPQQGTEQCIFPIVLTVVFQVINI